MARSPWMKDKQKYYSGYEVGKLDKDRGREKTSSLAMTSTNSEWKRGYEDGYSGKACEVKSPLEFLESLMTEGVTPDKLRAWANELSNHVVSIRDADVGKERKTWARDLWRTLASEADLAGCGGSAYTSAYSTLSFFTTRMVDRELSDGEKKNLHRAMNDMVDYLRTWGKKKEATESAVVREAALPMEGNEEKMISFFKMMGFEDLGKKFIASPAERGSIAFVMGYVANQRLGPEKGVKMMDLLRRFTDKPGPDGTATAKGLSMIGALKAQGRIKKEATSPRSESTYTPSRKRQELLQKIADLDDKILAAGKGTPERKNLEAEEERLTKELQAVYKTGESTTQKEDSNTLDKDEQRALQYFKDEGWHTYSDASEMGASLGINYGRAKTILQSLIARKLIVRNPHGYDTYAIDESGGDADAELRAKYSERQKLAAKHDLTADDQRRVAQLDRQIRDLRQLLARRESKEEPTRDTDGKFSGSGSTAKKKPYKSPYSQLSQAHKDKFDAKFPGPGMKEDKENPIPGEEVPHNYYEWPHVGWEKQKARIAKGMSVSELHYARIDCDKAARANPGTDTESKYRDEGSIYAQELRRRGGK
jgi:DNA-binding MarR family transcriptional regulator